jgi:hypothetical protein
VGRAFSRDRNAFLGVKVQFWRAWRSIWASPKKKKEKKKRKTRILVFSCISFSYQDLSLVLVVETAKQKSFIAKTQPQQQSTIDEITS